MGKGTGSRRRLENGTNMKRRLNAVEAPLPPRSQGQMKSGLNRVEAEGPLLQRLWRIIQM